MTIDQLMRAIELTSSTHTPETDELAGRFIDAFEMSRSNQQHVWPAHQYAIVLRILQSLGVVLAEPGTPNMQHMAVIMQGLNRLHINTQPKERTYADKTGVPSEAVASVAASLAPLPKT